ncbi:NAD+ synthase [Synechococcus elongatus]|uniref:Glutamine-dependent NAD(+) synthetase n=1 Tax=Synechococcus elongatus PCC 11801 TaxID=2219813 RepID=A0AAN1QLU6_SYNEL|nr:NAD+ synthase [Synechococcus elongatus]AZB71742.1 NAD+ synthase [Synechococcus elongatus PCC 11801]
MKLAIAQLNPTIGDLTGNTQAILAAARQAQQAGARLLLTPELSLCGYPPRDLLLLPDFLTAISEHLEQLCREAPKDIALLVGAPLPNPQAGIDGGKPLFNGAVLIENGAIRDRFYKQLLPTYDVFDEDRYFQSGQGGWFDLQAEGETLRVGVSICEDLWNEPEFWGERRYGADPIAALVADQIDLLVNLSASPYCFGKPKLREALLRHTCRRYQIPLLYANQVGGNDDLIFDGNSFVLDAAGKVLQKGAHCQTELLWIESQKLQAQEVAAAIASPSLTESQQDLAELWDVLVLGLRDYTRKCGFKSIVLGLSGGIDSALVAALAAAAIGAENVLTILMPSPYSSDHSITDAIALAENLQIRHETIAIAPLMTVFESSLADLFAGRSPDVTEENIQSRIRGTLLMAAANKLGSLLVTTGNKSELAVGYCTLYGDMNGGLAAIADLPKTWVYQLCHWLNSEDAAKVRSQQFPQASLPLIPTSILTKAPSAELRPDQVDQDSLPDYAVLDDILVRLIEKHQSREEILASGHSPEVLNQVLTLLRRAEFKRKQAAPGLKVTDRAFGTGWRMPIACRWG